HLVEALSGFYNYITRKLHLANESNIEALWLSDYRPITLINSLVKIITKSFLERLAPRLNELRCIHDNFLYVQKVNRKLHKNKTLALFIKLDISKAFDTINWVFLREVLTALGFGQRWRNRISTIFSSSSSCIIINGRLGKRDQARVRPSAGDPQSPMIFILAIDPLQKIIELAAQREGLLQWFLGKIAKFPGTYLWLPLHSRSLRRIEVQPLFEKVARVERKFVIQAGRERLVMTVLLSQSIYHLTVFQAQKW
ncbi:hypothetical protein U9M48_001992, partial [Paspalum notatum var. saurae]